MKKSCEDYWLNDKQEALVNWLEDELKKAVKSYRGRYDWIAKDILRDYYGDDEDIDKYVEKFHDEVKEIETDNALGYKNGDRIKCVHMCDKSDLIKDNELGTVDYVENDGTIHVKWDCGEYHHLIPGEDLFEEVY